MRGGTKNRSVTDEDGDVDPETVDRLDALASPNRWRLLGKLEQPRSVSDIELPASPERGEQGTISTQGVRHHLGKLREVGLVEVRSTKRGGRRVNEYVTDPTGLYELAETLRRRSSLGNETALEAPPSWDADTEPRPRLRVVHGDELGRAFPLREDQRRGGRGWVIGRGGDADVALDWDPEVGRQAGEIQRRDDGLELVDLRASPRRLSVEGRPLDRGEVTEVTDGDLVGVGRTLLRLET